MWFLESTLKCNVKCNLIIFQQVFEQGFLLAPDFLQWNPTIYYWKFTMPFVTHMLNLISVERRRWKAKLYDKLEHVSHSMYVLWEIPEPVFWDLAGQLWQLRTRQQRIYLSGGTWIDGPHFMGNGQVVSQICAGKTHVNSK